MIYTICNAAHNQVFPKEYLLPGACPRNIGPRKGMRFDTVIPLHYQKMQHSGSTSGPVGPRKSIHSTFRAMRPEVIKGSRTAYASHMHPLCYASLMHPLCYASLMHPLCYTSLMHPLCYASLVHPYAMPHLCTPYAMLHLCTPYAMLHLCPP